MLKKLALDQTKVYEKHIALEEISIMLVKFVKGIPHNLAIGAEQGGIDKWDDFVIKTNQGTSIYIQVKRQTTAFCTGTIIRGKSTTGKKAVVQKKLSKLDEVFQSLAKRISDPDQSNLENEFWIVLPDSGIEIKKKLLIRDMRRFASHIKSITTPSDLEDLAKIDENAKNIYDWLTTWCDFTGWETICKAFKILKIKTPGFEEDIDRRVRENLSQIFKTKEIDTVIMLIFSYLDKNGTFAGAIKPRQLLYLLQVYLSPNIGKWVSFRADSSTWDVSGIHDLEDNEEVERPSVVVPSVWCSDNSYSSIVRIHGSCEKNCCVSESLLRLALHPRGSHNILFSDRSSWEKLIESKTGLTLGLTDHDFKYLHIMEESDQMFPTESKKYITMLEKEKLSEELHCEMYKFTFKLVDEVILNKIRDMMCCDLRTEIEERWTCWKTTLITDVEKQKNMFSKILHPVIEGEYISGALRVGPKTVDLLGEAIFLLLIISVCLGNDDNQNWESISNNLKMTAVGLTYWSGPAGGKKKIIRIDEDTDIGKLLENEKEEIIIIPQSELCDSEIFQDDLSNECTKMDLLTHPKYPKLLITQDRNFRKMLKSGNKSKLTEDLILKIKKFENNIEHAITEVVGDLTI